MKTIEISLRGKNSSYKKFRIKLQFEFQMKAKIVLSKEQINLEVKSESKKWERI